MEEEKESHEVPGIRFQPGAAAHERWTIACSSARAQRRFVAHTRCWPLALGGGSALSADGVWWWATVTLLFLYSYGDPALLLRTERARFARACVWFLSSEGARRAFSLLRCYYHHPAGGSLTALVTAVVHLSTMLPVFAFASAFSRSLPSARTSHLHPRGVLQFAVVQFVPVMSSPVCTCVGASARASLLACVRAGFPASSLTWFGVARFDSSSSFVYFSSGSAAHALAEMETLEPEMLRRAPHACEGKE